MAAGDKQRPVAGELAHRRWRAAAAIKVQLIAHDQIIEINHQQGVFLFRIAHALKQILCPQPAFFFAAGGNEANTVTGGNVL